MNMGGDNRRDNSGGNRRNRFLKQQKHPIRQRTGRTVLEMVLIAGVAIFICASIIFGALYFINRNKADPGKVTTAVEDTTSEAEDTTEEESTEPEESAGTMTAATDSTNIITTETSTAASVTETTPASESTTAETYVNPSNMYSSYAHMKTFDPLTGLAEFDYFDILRGADAIAWLVAEEGYTQAEAEAEVNNYADSEFVYKNVNPQLRTADMKTIPITMMYQADGTPVDGAETVALTYHEFRTLYAAHPDSVLDSFFYYCTVAGGTITKVDQVYWP